MRANTHRSVCRSPSTGTTKRVRVADGTDRAVAVLDRSPVVPQHVGDGVVGRDAYAVLPVLGSGWCPRPDVDLGYASAFTHDLMID
jgi:hypothetical protein